MHKIYLLLRDNKESGPYTLDELLQLSLKPFDLIWVEGRSAGWQYPNEVESLKPFVPRAPQTTPKKEARSSPGPGPNPTAPPPGGATKARIPASASPPSARHIYVSFPAGSPSAFPLRQPGHAPEPSPEDLLEQKAEAIRARVQAFEAGKKKTEEDVQTNYSRSLDDMKEEYASWVFRQKTKQKRGKLLRKVLVAACFVLLFTLGGFFFVNRFMNGPQNEPQTVALPDIHVKNEATDEWGKAPDTELKEAVVLANSTNLSPPAATLQENRTANEASLSAVANSVPEPRKSKSTARKPALSPPAIPRTTSQPLLLPENFVRAGAPDATAALPPAPASQAPDPATTASGKPKSNATSSIQLKEQYVWDDNNGINGALQLTLQNSGKEKIKMVEVDVYYYRKDKSLLQKKTLVFNDIPADGSVSHFVPKMKKADSVKAQVALISSNGGMYYLR